MIFYLIAAVVTIVIVILYYLCRYIKSRPLTDCQTFEKRVQWKKDLVSFPDVIDSFTPEYVVFNSKDTIINAENEIILEDIDNLINDLGEVSVGREKMGAVSGGKYYIPKHNLYIDNLIDDNLKLNLDNYIIIK